VEEHQDKVSRKCWASSFQEEEMSLNENALEKEDPVYL
jgi:Fe-S cluster biosynthesis and repair protein YggX